MLAVAVVMAGCTTNISGDPEYPTGFKVGQVYVLPVALHAIVHRHYGRISSYELLTPSDYALQLRKNEDAHRRGKPAPFVSSGEEELVELLAGTEIVVTKLEVDHTGSGREMLLIAEFASGPFARKFADVRFVCRSEKLPGGSMFGWMAVRDPRFLIEKEQPNKAPDRTAPSVTPPAAQEPRH